MYLCRIKESVLVSFAQKNKSMEKVGNYLPWEQGYYKHNGSYKKSNGDLIFCYTYYFSGKAEQIETKFPIDVK